MSNFESRMMDGLKARESLPSARQDSKNAPFPPKQEYD